MKYKKQRGYTLLELMMVIAIMTMISITVMQDRMTEISQLKAKAMGVEIGHFANGLGGYVDFYSGRDPSDPSNPNSPTNGEVKNGVNFLKSNTCSSAETTSTGAEPIGFIAACDYLSRTTKPALDQKTTFGALGFKTTFYRDTSLPEPFRLEAIAYLDEFKGIETGQSMTTEMGLAATVAGGIRVNSSGNSVLPHVVVFCITESGGSNLYNRICAGHQNQIGVYVGQDAAASPYLRTDGGNQMQNRIRFDSGIDDLNKTIENLSWIQLNADDPVDGIGKLGIGQDLSNPIFKIDRTNLKVNTTAMTIDKGQVTLKDSNGFLVVQNGYINAKKSISSGRSMEAPVFLPYKAGTDPLSGSPNVNVGYRMVIDDKTELNKVAVDKLSFGKGTKTGTNNRADSSAFARIENKDNNKNLKITSSELNLKSIDKNSFKLTGDTNVANLNIEMADGSFKSLAKLLPRYTFLGAQTVETFGGKKGRVDKAPYELLGCERNNLKIIVTPQSSYVSGIQHTTANWVEIDWKGVQPRAGYSIGGGKTYQLDNPEKGVTYGNLVVDVKDQGSSWSVLIDTTAAQSNGGNASYVSKYRGGNALAQVYCLNSIKR